MKNLTDSDILRNWHHFASQLPSSIGSYLNLLCERQKTTLDVLLQEFDAEKEEFDRLRSMRPPRPDSFAQDAHRIAVVCGLGNPLAFVRAMVLAQKLVEMKDRSFTHTSYQAAFDAIDGLDDLPEE